jgi:hypothetical protein
MQARETEQAELPRHDDADTFKITDRDINGMALCAEQYAAPYDLLPAAAVCPWTAPLRGADLGDRSRPHPQTPTITSAVMRALMSRASDYGPGGGQGQQARYGQVVYLTAPTAAPS